jgi:eukaryotic-like serine/threonine-protein kinase
VICPRCHRSFRDYRYCPYDGAALLICSAFELIQARPTPMAGLVVDGRYTLRGFLGEGGMSQVFLAQDAVTSAPVAVKILREHLARDSALRKRFFREVEVAAEIGHPNIATVLDAGELPDRRPFIVVEYMFGESLGEYLRRESRAPPDLALSFMRQAATALEEAHSARVTHRDVKPDNLFLLGEIRDPYALKVMDFGFAKLNEAPLTAAGHIVGTIEYMPPEQALADLVDARSDIYSLGAVLFRMLVGRLPFSGADQASIVAKHVFVPVPRASELQPGLPDGIDALIMRAMRKDPAQRYASMADLVVDLDWVAQGRPDMMHAATGHGALDSYTPRNAIGQAAVVRLRRVLDTVHVDV